MEKFGGHTHLQNIPMQHITTLVPYTGLPLSRGNKFPDFKTNWQLETKKLYAQRKIRI
jgi:hypothetical protein